MLLSMSKIGAISSGDPVQSELKKVSVDNSLIIFGQHFPLKRS